MVALSVLRATRAQLLPWRRQPPQGVAASLLKHAADQTVAATVAVVNALTAAKLPLESFRDWGVLAAPCFFGRRDMAQAFERYATDGAWGISPHLVPNVSLHAVSGTISQALELHGCNFGIGGGPSAAAEAFLATPVLLGGGNLPGLWLILSSFFPEFLPGCRDEEAAECLTAALALTGNDGDHEASCLRICPRHTGDDEDDMSEFSLPAFAAALGCRADGHHHWRLPGAGWVELAMNAGQGA